MSNGTLKTNNYLSLNEWKAISVKWIKTPNIPKPRQCQASSADTAGRNVLAVKQMPWGLPAPGYLGWEDWAGPGYGHPWSSKWRVRPSGTNREYLLARWQPCRGVISEKWQLDHRARVCFHDTSLWDFSKCILGVSQRVFFKNKSHILFFQTSFIFDIWLTYSGQSNPFCWSELWQVSAAATMHITEHSCPGSRGHVSAAVGEQGLVESRVLGWQAGGRVCLLGLGTAKLQRLEYVCFQRHRDSAGKPGASKMFKKMGLVVFIHQTRKNLEG